MTKPAIACFSVLLWVALTGCNSSSEPAAPEPAVQELAEPEPTTQPAAAAPGPEAPPVPAGASVSFAEPEVSGGDGDGHGSGEGPWSFAGPLVDGKVAVNVKMLVKGMKVEPAGPVAAGSGHHHIIVDGEAVAQNVPVPKDDTHLHFGKGQTEATLQLTPGEHSLTLQFADGLHRSYGPSMTATVKISVAAAP